MTTIDPGRLRRLAGELAQARGGSEAMDLALLTALGWRPDPMADGVCWLSWGEDPAGNPIWTGTEPRPTRRAEDARRLYADLFPGEDGRAPALPEDALAICRALVARLAAAA